MKIKNKRKIKEKEEEINIIVPPAIKHQMELSILIWTKFPQFNRKTSCTPMQLLNKPFTSKLYPQISKSSHPDISGVFFS